MWRDRSLLAISLSVGVALTGVGMVLPVRVLYAQSRGASLALIGAMASSYLLSNFLFQYPSGWLADLWGRKRMMALGMLAQALLSLLYLGVTDPVLFVALRFVEGMVSASVLPAARALVNDTVPEERRGEAYGIFGAFLNAGFLLGPAIGGLFATTGYATAFVGSAVCRVVALVLVLTLVSSGGRVHPESRARARAVPRRALFTRPLIGVYVLYVGDSLWLGFELTLLPLWMRHHLGAGIALIGVSYAAWALPVMLCSPLGGRLADRRRRSLLILVFGLAQVPIYTAYGLVTAIGPVIAIFLIHGAIYSFVQPAVDATLAAASPPDARARAQSVYSAIGVATAFLAANTFTALYAINFRLPLFAMAGGVGICVLIGVAILRASERDGRLLDLRPPAAVAG